MFENLPEAVLPLIEDYRQRHEIDAKIIFGIGQWVNFLRELLDDTEERTLLVKQTFAALQEHGFFTSYSDFDCLRQELRSALLAEERAFLQKELAAANTHELLLELVCRSDWEKMDLKADVADAFAAARIHPSTCVARLTSRSRILHSDKVLLFMAAYWASVDAPFAEWQKVFSQLHPFVMGGDGRHDTGRPEFNILAEVATRKMLACVRAETMTLFKECINIH